MGVNHCRAHIVVPEQLLYGSNVITIFEQMSREVMTQGMTAGRLEDLSFDACFLKYFQVSVNYRERTVYRPRTSTFIIITASLVNSHIAAMLRNRRR